MKHLFDQMPKLIDMTLQKALEASNNDDPKLQKARNKLINQMREITRELQNLSDKYNDPKQLSLKL